MLLAAAAGLRGRQSLPLGEGVGPVVWESTIGDDSYVGWRRLDYARESGEWDGWLGQIDG